MMALGRYPVAGQLDPEGFTTKTWAKCSLACILAWTFQRSSFLDSIPDLLTKRYNDQPKNKTTRTLGLQVYITGVHALGHKASKWELLWAFGVPGLE